MKRGEVSCKVEQERHSVQEYTRVVMVRCGRQEGAGGAFMEGEAKARCGAKGLHRHVRACHTCSCDAAARCAFV